MPTKIELENELNKIKEQRKKQYDRQNQFIKDNYKRISCNIKPSVYNAIIEKYGSISINGYINDLIKKDLNIME